MLQARRDTSLFVFLILTASTTLVTGQEPQPESTTPAHVRVLVDMFRGELEELRFLMGRRTNKQPELNVQGAAPREVYFQALTMFQKANRLCFEHTRQRMPEPPLPTGDITPSDVRDVVNAALLSLRQVKTNYGMNTEIPPGPLDESMLPTDVFKSIVQANRQLNLMLDRQFAPSDVFQQVTRAVGYASRSLEQFPDATPIPDEPDWEEGKLPGDVYRRLLVCFERVRQIAKLSGLEMLEVQIDESLIQQAEPSDVFDIASLVVAELAYLHSKLPESSPPRDVYYVGRKFPAHVFQRAGILDRQLVELEQWVGENPHWLSQESTGK